MLLLYPGVKATIAHRLARRLWLAHFTFGARLIAEFARFATGIEIHPGAVVGEGLVIDHGMGVVIGETAVIGKNVLIYHGVTLGGTSAKRERRHPTVGDDVVIGAGAKLLGAITVGKGARIGANAVVTRDVPAGATFVGVPARPISPKESEA